MVSTTVRSISSSIASAETWLASRWSLHPFDPVLLPRLRQLAAAPACQAPVALIAGRHRG